MLEHLHHEKNKALKRLNDNASEKIRTFNP
jgi:hypothetical protein